RIEPVLGEDALLQPPPCTERVDVQAMAAAVREFGDDKALFLEPGERLPEAGWDGDPPLVVHHVLEVPPKHPTGRGGLPHNASLHNRHAPPLPTAARGYTPRARRLSRRLPPVGLKRKPRAALPRAARGPGGIGGAQGAAQPRPSSARAPARYKRRRRSVSRILFPRSSGGGSSHSSGPPVARGIERPTRGNGRTTRARPGGPDLPPTRSCSGWGLPSIRPHERIWRALTSPFHPCSRLAARGGLFSVALSPDRSRPPLAATLPSGVRTFLPPRCAAGGCSTSSVARRTAVRYPLASAFSGRQYSMRWQLGQRITCSLRWISLMSWCGTRIRQPWQVPSRISTTASPPRREKIISY